MRGEKKKKNQPNSQVIYRFLPRLNQNRKAGFKIHNPKAHRNSGVRKAGMYIVALSVRDKTKK